VSFSRLETLHRAVSTRINLRRTVTVSALLLLTVSLTGCGTDMLTYSNDSKAEGIRKYNDGRYADAAGSFRNAARQNPTDDKTQYWLGLSFEQCQDYHEAIGAYIACLKLMAVPNTVHYDPKYHDDVFDRLAHLVARTDNTGVDVDAIQKDADAKSDPELYRLMGRIFRYRNDPDTAMQDYKHAVALAPDNYADQKEYGLYLEQLNQTQDAAVVLRDAYRLNQSDTELTDALVKIGITPGPALMAQGGQMNIQPPPDAQADPSTAAPASSTVGPNPDAAGPKN